MYSEFEPPRSGRGRLVQLPPLPVNQSTRYVTTEIYQDSPSVYRPPIESTQIHQVTTLKESYANQVSLNVKT